MYIKEKIQKRGKYKYTYYQTPTHTHTHTLQNPYVHTATLYKTHTYAHHTLQNNLKQTQYKIHTK